VRLQGIHDDALKLSVNSRRAFELLLGVVRRLLGELLRLHQLALDHVVDIDQLFARSQVALEQVVRLGDQLGQPNLGIGLNLTGAAFAGRIDLDVVAGAQVRRRSQLRGGFICGFSCG
jgi:hypothetical protein